MSKKSAIILILVYHFHELLDLMYIVYTHTAQDDLESYDLMIRVGVQEIVNLKCFALKKLGKYTV
jgi:hypothetical protein